jgi:tRNA threonylcarbamoyladenosine biosynthesis protein TsaE
MSETFLMGEGDLSMLAEKVEQELSSLRHDKAAVILLEGDLGAGKTTFTKALAGKLGIEQSDVHSPTFILKKEYPVRHPRFRKLIHVDAYRFTHPDEAQVLRLEEDLKDPNSIIVVEWPSRMSHLKSDIDIEFRVQDEITREVVFTRNP